MTADAGAPHLDLSFRRHPVHGTWLDRRLFRWPYTLARGFRPDLATRDMLSVILQTVSGAIQADDRLVQRLHVGRGATVRLSTQGAAPVYRAPAAAAADEDVQIVVEDGGFIEYLPDIRILFPDARLAQRTTILLPATATAIIADGFVMHDPDGERRPFGCYRSEIVLRRPDGGLLSMDRLCLDAPPRDGGRRAAFGAYGSLVVATGRPEPWLEALRTDAEARMARLAGVYGAASTLPNGAGVSLRMAAIDGRHLRLAIHAAWSAARLHFLGREPS